MELRTPPEVTRKISLAFRRGCLAQKSAGDSGGEIPSSPATTSTPKSAAASLKSPASQSLPKKVLLEEWWLVKSVESVNGKRIGVGGISRAGTRARREFTSAAIVIRYDAWNLETADGVLVKLVGNINSLRSYQNGFRQEICCIFMTGFPDDWEIYADGLSGSNAPKAFADGFFTKKVDLDSVSAGEIFDFVASGCIDSVQECIDFVSKNFHINDEAQQMDSVSSDSKEGEAIVLELKVEGKEDLQHHPFTGKLESILESEANADEQKSTYLEELARIGETSGRSSNENSCMKRKRPYYSRQAKAGYNYMG